MPANNNLEPAKLPMQIKFGKEPTTKFVNNLDAIKVELISAPTIQQLRDYMPQFVEATWARFADEAKALSDVEKDQIISDVFHGKCLPTALETVNLVFKIDGISLQEVTHLLRYRTASFSADCSGDKWWTDKDALVPNSIENSGAMYKRYTELVEATKALYVDMIDTKKISIMDARYILPRCLSTFYFMRISAKDLIHVIQQRIDKQIQPETDNVIAYKLYTELVAAYPFTRDIIDIHHQSDFYVKMARTGKATNLYFPDADSDSFEWNEKDFIYQCKRDEMNGTAEGAKNKFNRYLRATEVKLGCAGGKSSVAAMMSSIEADIMMGGTTSTTHEAVGASYKFDNITLSELIEAGLNEDDFMKLVDSSTYMSYEQGYFKIGPYLVKEYIDMFKQLDQLCIDVKGCVCTESRQLVISFPRLHCFQNIQLLIRDKEVTCIANMRSCNFEDNFLTDLSLAWYCAAKMEMALGPKHSKSSPVRTLNVIMNIGSLHIFKKRNEG